MSEITTKDQEIHKRLKAIDAEYDALLRMIHANEAAISELGAERARLRRTLGVEVGTPYRDLTKH